MANRIVNAQEQPDRVLVHFKVFAVAEAFALETLQFLPDGQESPFNVRSCGFYASRISYQNVIQNLLAA